MANKYMYNGKRRYLHMHTILCGTLTSQETSYQHDKEAERQLITGIPNSESAGFSLEDSQSYNSHTVSLDSYNRCSEDGPSVFPKDGRTCHLLVSCFFVRLDDMGELMPDIQRIATTQQRIGMPIPKLFVLNKGHWESWLLETAWTAQG